MRAIYKRELCSYFTSMVGYVFIAALLFFNGIYYMAYNLFSGYTEFGYTLISSTLVFMVVIPILTMRSFAEEKRSRTDQMLLTAPVSVSSIVLGKYLAMVTVFVVPMVILSACPLIILANGTTNLAADYGAILAFFLMGCVFIAIGMFVSALTESQIIAAVGTFVILLILYLWGSLVSFLPNVISGVLGTFDFQGVLNNFAYYSVFDLGGVILYLSIAALMVFATVQVVSRRRGVRVAPLMVVTVAVCVVVNLVVGQLPTSLLETDLTDNSLYSVSETSQEFLDSLEYDVDLIVLADDTSVDTILNKFLSNYVAASSHLSLEYIDPVTHPSALTEYDASANQIVVSCEATGRSQAVSIDDILVYDLYSYYYYGTTSYTEFDGEGQLASAINYVTSETTSMVYTLTGHGESDLGTSVVDAIDKVNLTTDEVNLLLNGGVPEDCDLLICYAPTSDFSAEEIELLDSYLQTGGQFILILSESDLDLPNLESLMADYGMTLLDGYVGDTSRYYQQFGSVFYMSPVLSSSCDITSSLSDSYLLIYGAHAITVGDPVRDTITVTSFMSTSDGGYLDATQETGTYSVGVLATEDVENEVGETVTARFTVFTSESIVDEDVISAYPSMVNLDVFMNALTAGLSDVTGPSIAAKNLSSSYNTFTNPSLWAILFVGVLPLGTLLFGLIYWIQRRKQ